jgi:hypothetical protein
MFVRLTRDLCVVRLRHPVSRVREAVREVAVIREQHESGGRNVQSAHRKETGHRPRQQMAYGQASLRIPNCTQHAPRFVQQHVSKRLDANASPVHFDAVHIRFDSAAGLAHDGAIQAHVSASNELVCPAA